MPMYPRDRLLAFLAKIANEPGPDLEPRNWLEYYLDKIAENGGGGGCECNLTTLDLNTVPEYTVTVDNVEYSSRENELEIVIDNTLDVEAGNWFVYAAPNPPCMLYRLDPGGASQYVPGMIGTFENFQADLSGSLPAGLYLESADQLMLCMAGSDLFAFLTNPTFRHIGFN